MHEHLWDPRPRDRQQHRRSRTRAAALLDHGGPGLCCHAAADAPFDERWETLATISLDVGDRVSHDKYGLGTVVTVDGGTEALMRARDWPSPLPPRARCPRKPSRKPLRKRHLWTPGAAQVACAPSGCGWPCSRPRSSPP